MTVERWPRVGEDRVDDYEIFRIRRIRARSPRTGEARPFTLLESADWVNVVALTTDDRMLLIRQYRHGSGRVELEIPGGVVEAGEDPGAAAVRELREETGWAGAAPIGLGSVAPNPAIQSNRCHFFLVRDCVRVDDPDLDPGEDIEVVPTPVAEIDARVADGHIEHALVLCALAAWRAAADPGLDGKGDPPSTRS